MRNLVLQFLVLCFVPPQPHLQFWEDHPGSEKLWPFIKDALLDIQGIPTSHEQKHENNQRAWRKRKQWHFMPSWAPTRLSEFQGKRCTSNALCNQHPQYSLEQHSYAYPANRDGTAEPRAPVHCFRWSEHSSAVQAKQRLPAPRRGPGPGLGLESRRPLPRHCDHHVPGKGSARAYIWLCCVRATNATGVTDCINYSSLKTWYFFIYMSFAFGIDTVLLPTSGNNQLLKK